MTDERDGNELTAPFEDAPPQEYLVHVVTTVPCMARVLVFPNGSVEINTKEDVEGVRYGSLVVLKGRTDVSELKSKVLVAMVSQYALQRARELAAQTLEREGFNQLVVNQPPPQGIHS